MAFVMNRNFLFFVSATVLVALAACGKGDDDKATASNDAAKPAAAAAPALEKKVPDLVRALSRKAGVTTPEEKAAAIARARANAQAAAQAVGQDATQIAAAGDAAAAAAQRSFDERQAETQAQ